MIGIRCRYTSDIGIRNIWLGHDPSKCLEEHVSNGLGLQPDNDCLTCDKPPKQGCDDGYIMNAFPTSWHNYHGCTRITCTKPGNI